MRNNVLIIDDDLDTISFISLILEQENFEVIATTDANEGLAYFELNKPAVLILDLEMPSMNGLEVLNTILPGIEKDFSVIILTGYGNDKNIKLCYDLGVYAFLSKPVRLVELKGLVRNAMLWEEYKSNLKEHKEQLENLVSDRTHKLTDEINTRKDIEKKLIKLNQVKDRILNILTWDLRAPLSNVVMNLKNLQENSMLGISEEARHQLTDVYNEAKNTWQLTDNLFLWSRCQKGEIANNPENCNLSSVINDVLLLLSNSIKSKSINIKQEIDSKTEIVADRKIVYTVIQNILSNAIKFSNVNGNIQISIVEDKSNVKLLLKDFGIGMSEDVLSSLFDITKPISTLGTDEEKGSGLGLIVCKELSKIIGASIDIQSEVGKGTEVKVNFQQAKTLN